jgi:hypothetical protein
LVMAPVSGTDVYQNTYQNGQISQSGAAATKSAIRKVSRFGRFIPVVGPGASAAAGAADDATTSATGADSRTYVPGEKMWVTNIEVREDGVVLSLFTDPVANRDNMRFKAALRFPFPKGSMPPADQVEGLIAEVFKVQPGNDGNAQAAAPGAPDVPPAAPQRAQQPAEPVLEPIAPPPPPPDAPTAPPKTISLGQTKDEVVAIFGQPDKVVKLGAKEMLFYKDMKVTLVSDKVTDVQ